MHKGERSTAVHTRPIGRDDWPLIESLFGQRGACGGCWCMWWRVPMGGRTWDAAKGTPNRKAFRALVESGSATGVLAFVDDAPVGWCAIGPRGDFPRLDRSRSLARHWTADTWSLNCLYIPPPRRGQGIARALVASAVELARTQGAGEVEAYPTSLAVGERQAGAFLWTGVPALYEPLGFVPLRPAGRGRRLYVLRMR